MMIRVPNAAGSEMSAYLSLPKKAKGPGVVVLQEIFGVTEAMKKVCDFLAARQFTVICPDLYWSVAPDQALPESDPEPARALRMKLDDNKVAADIGAAIAFLRKHEACTGRVAVVGYCWGGLLSFLAATQHSPDAAVAYYGVGIEKRLELAPMLTCPLLLHYGKEDAYVPPEAVAKVRDTFKGNDKVSLWEYNAGHAFARPGGAHYHHPSADLADMRTTSFLVEALFGPRKLSNHA